MSNSLRFLSTLSLISFFMLLPAANTGKRRTALYSSGFISPAFVDPLASLYPTASWIVDPPSGDSHREENKRATSFVISRRRFYWRCGLNRYFSALASRLSRGYKIYIFLQYLSVCIIVSFKLALKLSLVVNSHHLWVYKTRKIVIIHCTCAQRLFKLNNIWIRKSYFSNKYNRASITQTSISRRLKIFFFSLNIESLKTL